MKIRVHLLISFLCYFSAYAHQWLYPVAQLSDGSVLLLHQKDATSTQLFFWDPETNAFQPALSPCYTPLGVTVIPQSSTFSFIDNGRIRIQEATKRSAYALPIDIPLYDIGPVSWTSHGKGFFSAKAQGNYAIYSTDLQGHVTPIAQSPGIDYLYPSCTDTCLFYITRRIDDRVAPRCPKHAQCRCRPINPVDAFLYSIHMIPCNTHGDVVRHNDSNASDGRLLVRESERSLVFLTMISETYGFVLEHERVLPSDADSITLTCHQIYKDDTDSWALSYLFSYTIPMSLIKPGSNERLCEGFLPFVPHYASGTFYFVDYKGDGLAPARRSLPSSESPDKRRGALYSYEVDTMEMRTEVAPYLGSLFCAPISTTTSAGNYLVYGGVIQGEPTSESMHVKDL